jgi:hypothetical protein
MQKVTTGQLSIFFEALKAAGIGGIPEGYEQIRKPFLDLCEKSPWLVDDIMAGFITASMHGLIKHGDTTLGPLTIFLTGFQIGREFEANRADTDELKRLFRKVPKPK